MNVRYHPAQVRDLWLTQVHTLGMRAWPCLWCLLVLPLGCGGGTTKQEGDAGQSSGGQNTGGTTGGQNTGGKNPGGSASGGSSGAAGAASGACPAKPPLADSPCSVEGSGLGFAAAHCSWGDDRRPGCRVSALCSNGAWSVSQPPAECATTEPLPAACPKTASAATGDCDDATLSCWYDDGSICRCSPCVGGSEYPICQEIDPPQWACTKPDAACPNPLPQAGSACDVSADVSCGPSCELPIRCREGAWVYDGVQCPICAAPNTPIATPEGERDIAELAAGDLVYSMEPTGVVVVPLLRVASTPVVEHRVVEVELASGALLRISPRHPTADGRRFEDLLGGGQLDSSAIVRARLVPYAEARTYDILPDSSTGTYFAGGALIGSTLKALRR